MTTHIAPDSERPAPSAHRAATTIQDADRRLKKTTLEFIRRRPLTSFLVWFFTVGQAWAFAPLLLEGVGLDSPVPDQVFILASTLVGLLLPTLVVTAVTDGRAAVGQLLRQAVAVRVPWRWYALALVVVPAISFGITALALGLPDASASTLVVAVLSGLALQLVLTLLPNNLWEEVAWTGFVQHRLQQRHRPAAAAAITGVLFALQHISLAVGNSPADVVAVMTVLIVLVIPFRFLVGWIHNATGSLFLVGLLHGAGNAVAGGSGFGAGFLPRLYPDSTTPAVAHLITFALLGLAVLALTRGRLGAPSATHPTARDDSRRIR